MDEAFTPYFRQFGGDAPVPMAAEADDAPWNVQRGPIRQPLRELRDGEIMVADDGAALDAFFPQQGHRADDGVQYNIDFGDDIHIAFRPAVDHNGLNAARRCRDHPTRPARRRGAGSGPG